MCVWNKTYEIGLFLGSGSDRPSKKKGKKGGAKKSSKKIIEVPKSRIISKETISTDESDSDNGRSQLKSG